MISLYPENIECVIPYDLRKNHKSYFTPKFGDDIVEKFLNDCYENLFLESPQSIELIVVTYSNLNKHPKNTFNTWEDVSKPDCLDFWVIHDRFIDEHSTIS